MALNWLRRSKKKESKPKPMKRDEGLNEQLEALTLEVTTLKRKMAELIKKREECEGVILKLREESFKLQTQNENLTNEKEVLRKTIKAFEQQLRKIKKRRR